ncbi:uncharacterized protein MKK02DRAFT_30143 [Dioszegia hungarica]|uniref:Uncharacterized protein n=1 Tax=Dioszegia hungarica TaxID=4972 RepID=A0AA38H1J9_9TREE|nr:uncharacterized protein MKK02DRAFT_30143 [Dioszegia hungarica]KAI9632290.1 hypothetical protein MKK02DRAFT_30143 [Dioszegia hungarica]
MTAHYTVHCYGGKGGSGRMVRFKVYKRVALQKAIVHGEERTRPRRKQNQYRSLQDRLYRKRQVFTEDNYLGRDISETNVVQSTIYKETAPYSKPQLHSPPETLLTLPPRLTPVLSGFQQKLPPINALSYRNS